MMQASDERLYLKREDGGRGIKSLRDIYKVTRLRVACYMACSENKWIMEKRGRQRGEFHSGRRKEDNGGR